MDMKISGSGHIPGGEYEHISISGSGKFLGIIKCKSFRGAGSTHCDDDIICQEGFTISGSGHLNGNLVAGDARCAGSLHANKNVETMSSAHFSGSCRISGKCISHGELKISGSLRVGSGIEAEDVHISGTVECGGLLNAEKLFMELEKGRSHVASIGGSLIEIKPRPRKGNNRDASAGIILEVAEAIEGDDIRLTGVKADIVIGRMVLIGEGCKIGTVRYSERFEIDENAAVRHTEKI